MFDLLNIDTTRLESVTPVSRVEWRPLDALDAPMRRLEGWED